MSSIGHQQNQYPNRPPVVVRDRSTRIYKIDLKIAGWVIALSKGGQVS